jgi:hypothetical protein
MKKIFATIIITVLAVLGIAPAAQASTPAPTNMSYIALPHPDDEWQTWALVENSTSNYKVFMLYTQGEQTGYCNPKWTQECKNRRVQSWLDFYTQMSKTDPAVPGDWEALPRTAPFPTRGYQLHVDNGAGLVPADTSVQVYRDRAGRGAAVVFDLGDGDLTDKEVQWAIETTRDNRAALGINTTLPNWNLLGTYYNKYYSNCAVYAHADHYAVHRALWHVNFRMKYQAAATCKSDPDAKRVQSTTSKSADAAWRVYDAAFPSNYGWLGQYRFAPDQSQLFHGTQAYWTRHVN